MKKILYFTISSIIMLMMVSCSSPKEYRLGECAYIPDSLKSIAANFVIDATRAADQHLSGGDIEDQEDVIETAWRTAEKLYQVNCPCLYVREKDGTYFKTININAMSKTERALLDSLIKN